MQSLRHELAGPDGNPLYTDCAYLGPPDPEHLLVLISGPHGVETLCGSACQSAFLQSAQYRQLPASSGLLMIHALNCWGAAWLRRNTENNVDLCRNFIRFDQLPDFRERYAQAETLLLSAEFNNEDRSIAAAQVARTMQQLRPEVLVEALMGGQYHEPNGFAFGGAQPEWGHHCLETLLSPFASQAREVAIIEYHSGLGPYGYGMAVSMDHGRDLDRTRSWYGPWLNAPNEKLAGQHEDTHTASGHTSEGYRRFLPNSQVTAIVLEYGSHDMRRNLLSLLDDHWLYSSGRRRDDALAAQIKAELLEVHCPRDPHWRQSVLDRSRQVLQQAMDGLSGQTAYS